MAEPIVGTPAIVGFGNGFGGNEIGIGLAALLLQQNLSRDHADITRDVQSSTHDVEESVEANAMHSNELILQQASGTNTLVQSSLLEMTRLAAASALTAATNQAATLAAIATCCCDTRALIIEKANGTDALMRDLRQQDMAIQIADLKAELIAARAAGNAQHQ